MVASIYKITNKINGKIYIGFTSQEPKKRFKQHFKDAKRKDRTYIHKALNKYSIDNFKLETIYQSKDIYYCLETMGQYFIDQYSSIDRTLGYNTSIGGSATGLGRRVSDETKDKMSKSHLGFNHSKESLLKMSKAQKGHKVSKQQRKDIANTLANRWLIIDPNAIEFCITNLRKFSLDNNLNPYCMMQVANPKQSNKHHQGFKCQKITG